MQAPQAQRAVVRVCAVLLPLFTLAEVNYPHFTPYSQLAVFAGLGLVLIFLREGQGESGRALVVCWTLAAMSVLVCGYLIVQTEPLFRGWWMGGQSLGGRAGLESGLDLLVGGVGLLLVLEAGRRSVGWALPILSVLFVLYALGGRFLPSFMLPHRGYSFERIVGQSFLHSQGVFGIALRVMFTYVFLFVVFGALLEATGATAFIIGATRRLFQRTTGGAAKVAVLSSGLMGSLSGSAVANTASTGTFTIPMMRSSGFAPKVAGGIEAAASSGGALVPPVMGAGAYMMLEIIQPPVTYLQIVRAALLPACLYYLSLLLIVHLYARRLAVGKGIVETLNGDNDEDGEHGENTPRSGRFEGLLFVLSLASLIGFLLAGYSVFRAVSLALVVLLGTAWLHPRTRLGWRRLAEALVGASRNGLALIAAASCVGIVVGIVTLTGVGTSLPSLILPLAQNHLLGALVALMVSSLILGMGLPSAVCYLLLATLVGPVLGRLGVVPLSAHLFIFYFGLMSMVTPPVALAAYAASSIAGSRLFETAVSAFRFALVGFTLPYMFVFRPQLLMLTPSGETAGGAAIFSALVLAVAGIAALAIGIAGHLRRNLAPVERGVFFLAAALLLYPGSGLAFAGLSLAPANLLGLGLLVVLLAYQYRDLLKPAATRPPG